MNARSLPWLSLAALWVGNAPPVIGVLFLGWRLPEILFLYWFENAVVWYFNIQRMRLAEVPPKDPKDDPEEDINGFKLHFGLFTGIHGILLLAVFLTGGTDAANLFGEETPRWLQGSFFLGIPALFVSHWISHRVNFVGKQEYRHLSAHDLLFQPYPRMIALHATLLLGAVLVSVTGMPVALVFVLVIVKAGLDSVLHVREHARRQAQRAVPLRTDDG